MFKLCVTMDGISESSVPFQTCFYRSFVDQEEYTICKIGVQIRVNGFNHSVYFSNYTISLFVSIRNIGSYGWSNDMNTDNRSSIEYN